MLWPATAAAQAAAPADADARIQALLQRIDALERRLAALEAAAHTPPEGTGGDRAIAAAAPTTVERAGTPQPPAAPPAEAIDGMGHEGGAPLLTFRGYVDLDYRAGHGTAAPNTFSLGQYDLFAASHLSDALDFVSETVMEAGDNNEFHIELERALVEWKPGDLLHVAAGRYHTAIGWYNTAYHHGTWFQTAVGRPLLFAFEDEGGLLPVHNVGVTVGGRLPSAGANLHYTVEVGNGRDTRPGAEPVQNVADMSRGKAVNLAVFARPAAWPDWQAGASVYRDRVAGPGGLRVSETIAAGHVVYASQATEFLNEGVIIRHDPRTGGAATTAGFYSQVSHAFDRWRPYARYEYVRVPREEMVFPALGRLSQPSLGMRYDAAQFLALKAQLDLRRQQQQTIDVLTLQAAWTF